MMEAGKKPEGIDPRAKKDFVADFDFEFDEKHKTVSVTERGVAKAEKFLGIDHLYRAENGPLVNHLHQALKAESLYKRDVDYAVIDGEVKIIDEFTGRILEGRRWSEGLHQAVEAKEGVRVQEENQTLATITLQNYFRLYDKLAGMTGTALTEATEFMKIYKLGVVQIPTNRPMVRDDRNDQVYKTKDGKWHAVAREIEERHENGQPVLVGTISVEVSELLSEQLKRKGIPHTVLNAKPEYAEREGEIVAEAGQPGAVTIATNMAGRGVDIKLGGNAEHLTDLELAKLGLRPGDPDYDERFAEILPEHRGARRGGPREGRRRRRPVHHRHRAPRVAPHRQPAARPLRPPGRSRRVALLPLRRGRPRAPVRRRPHLPHPRPPRQHRRGGQRGADRGGDADQADREGPAQGRGAELPHPQARARVRRRHERAARGSSTSTATRCSRAATWASSRARRSSSVIERLVDEYAAGRLRRGLGPRGALRRARRTSTRSSVDAEEIDRPRTSAARSWPSASRATRVELYDRREEELGEELMRALERYLLLQIIDQRWREHLYDMDYLREGIHLRGFAQIDPLVAYKNEAFTLFSDLMNTIWSDFSRMIFHVEVAGRGRERRRARRSSTRRRARRRGRAASPTRAASGTAQPSALAEAAGAAGERGRAAARARPAAPRRRGRADRAQRPLLVRVGQEVQAVPRRVAPRHGTRHIHGATAHSAASRQRMTSDPHGRRPRG